MCARSGRRRNVSLLSELAVAARAANTSAYKHLAFAQPPICLSSPARCFNGRARGQSDAVGLRWATPGAYRAMIRWLQVKVSTSAAGEPPLGLAMWKALLIPAELTICWSAFVMRRSGRLMQDCGW